MPEQAGHLPRGRRVGAVVPVDAAVRVELPPLEPLGRHLPVLGAVGRAAQADEIVEQLTAGHGNRGAFEAARPETAVDGLLGQEPQQDVGRCVVTDDDHERREVADRERRPRGEFLEDA